MRVVDGVVLVPLVRLHAQLVRARLGDDFHHVPHVETALDELRRQPVEQVGVGRRVAGADVVDRLDDAGAGHVTPEAVHVAPGEVLVVGRGQPSGEGLSAATLLGRLVLGGKREGRRGDGAGAVVLRLAFGAVVNDLVQRLGPLDRRAADALVAGLVILLQADLREVGGRLVILILCPALERVVVALVAVEACGQKKVRCVLHDRVRFTQNLVVRGGRVVLVRAAGGDHFVGELVVWRVAGDLVANPFAELRRALGAEELAVHLQQVGPLVCPVVDVVFVADQFVDQLVALGPAVALVGGELADLLRAGRQAGQVEVYPAQELLVRGQAGRERLGALELGGDKFIGFVVGRNVLPLEAGAVAHHGHNGRGVRALVAGQHRRFASALGAHEAGLVGRGDVRVAGLDERLGGDVALLAVGVGGDDAHLLLVADLLHDRVLREQLDARDSRRAGVELRAVGDPAFENLVVILARLRQLAALVRHGGGRLEQDQAVVRRGDVHAATGQVVGEGAHVVNWVVPAQRELEAVLAVLRSVADAGVAAELREHRHHVAHVVRLELISDAAHADAQRARLVFVDNLERGLAVLDRLHHAAFADLDHIGVDAESKVPRGVVALAVALHCGEQQLVVVELAVEFDLPWLDRQRDDARHFPLRQRHRQEGAFQAKRLAVVQADHAIGPGGGHRLAVRAERRGVQRRVQRHLGQALDALGLVLGGQLFRLPVERLLERFFQLVAHGAVVVAAVKVKRPLTVVAAARGELFAV